MSEATLTAEPLMTRKTFFGPLAVPYTGHCTVCKEATSLAYQLRDTETPEREAWVYVCTRLAHIDRARDVIVTQMRSTFLGGSVAPGPVSHATPSIH